MVREVLVWLGRTFSVVPHIRALRSRAARIAITFDPMWWNNGRYAWGPWCIKSPKSYPAFDCMSIEHLYYGE